ncbi:SDR family NAD(P)-dependent oxidoreductase [Spirosoma rhododendri]|uniref:SDR family oxidoreductase n=1 Tax=Spirosoma rhododendri TaxID=2728024 RepID=A0A7L5DPQ8_9BACT|nr:SDR family oxidoreductase [Spirosoma rhododendri]QJD80105.1 SDR family oxidoreductase [Spirosoma rhododendri]
MNESLKGKVALITGGTTGIGQEVAQQLVGLGVRVVIAGRDRERGEEAAITIGDVASVRFVQADVSREEQVQALVQQTIAEFGRLDFLFNNAGVEGTPGPIADTTEQDIDQILAVNVKGVLLAIKHTLPRMLAQGGGIIVNTASFIGTVVPFPDAMPYGASKAAVLSISRSMAAGYGKDHIQTYAVCPWTTDTPMVDRLSGDQPDAKATFGASNPSGQLATPADIAQVVVALFRGEVTLANGEAVLVDSGGVSSLIYPMTFDKP